MSSWSPQQKTTEAPAVETHNLETYGDKIRNIIHSLNLENMLGSNEISQFIQYVRKSYKPRYEIVTAG